MTSDFRSVFATVLIDWFGCEEQKVKDSITNGGIGWGKDYDGNLLPDILEKRVRFMDMGCINALGTSAIPKKMEPVLYPNPAHQESYVRIHSQTKSDWHIRVFDINGRPLMDRGFQGVSAGTHNLSLNMGNLAAGTYLVEIRGEGTSWKKRLVVVGN
jgi:hypothetical protein